MLVRKKLLPPFCKVVTAKLKGERIRQWQQQKISDGQPKNEAEIQILSGLYSQCCLPKKDTFASFFAMTQTFFFIHFRRARKLITRGNHISEVVWMSKIKFKSWAGFTVSAVLLRKKLLPHFLQWLKLFHTLQKGKKINHQRRPY